MDMALGFTSRLLQSSHSRNFEAFLAKQSRQFEWEYDVLMHTIKMIVILMVKDSKDATVKKLLIGYLTIYGEKP